MRLIDADVLKKDILSQSILGESMAKVMDRYIHAVDAQPTAYDPDKIVVQIKELSIREFGEIKTEDVIAIVKGGGVDG